MVHIRCIKIDFVVALFLNHWACSSLKIRMFHFTSLKLTSVALKSSTSVKTVFVCLQEHIHVIQLQLKGLKHRSILFTNNHLPSAHLLRIYIPLFVYFVLLANHFYEIYLCRIGDTATKGLYSLEGYPSCPSLSALNQESDWMAPPKTIHPHLVPFCYSVSPLQRRCHLLHPGCFTSNAHSADLCPPNPLLVRTTYTVEKIMCSTFYCSVIQMKKQQQFCYSQQRSLLPFASNQHETISQSLAPLKVFTCKYTLKLLL